MRHRPTDDSPLSIRSRFSQSSDMVKSKPVEILIVLDPVIELDDDMPS
jgi:hypothetical protein